MRSFLDTSVLVAVFQEGHEYVAALTTFSHIGISGGTMYDALIASCALKAEAQTLYTWNARHWQQLGPAVSGRVRTP